MLVGGLSLPHPSDDIHKLPDRLPRRSAPLQYDPEREEMLPLIFCKVQPAPPLLIALEGARVGWVGRAVDLGRAVKILQVGEQGVQRVEALLRRPLEEPREGLIAVENVRKLWRRFCHGLARALDGLQRCQLSVRRGLWVGRAGRIDGRSTGGMVCDGIAVCEVFCVFLRCGAIFHCPFLCGVVLAEQQTTGHHSGRLVLIFLPSPRRL